MLRQCKYGGFLIFYIWSTEITDDDVCRQDVHVVHDDSDASPISPYDKIEMENESEYEVGKGTLVDEYHDGIHRHVGSV